MTIVGGEERARRAREVAALVERCRRASASRRGDPILLRAAEMLEALAIESGLAPIADEGSGIGELDRAKIAVAIERADVQKIPDGYADGATGQPAIKHEEVSDWSAWLADAVIAASISSREEIAENANCSD